MNIILKEIIFVVIAYLIGSFSFAKFFSKIFMKANVYKFGDYTADAGNVYKNISKTLGIIIWILDFARIYIILLLVDHFLLKNQPELLLIIGFSMVVAHYFPVLHKFIGGREEITYVAALFYFIPIPTIIISILAIIIVLFYKQIRFSKYVIVIMPPILYYILQYFSFLSYDLAPIYLMLTSIVMGIISFLVSHRTEVL